MEVGQLVLPDKEITEEIIAAAIAVHKTPGPGFLESIYEPVVRSYMKATNTESGLLLNFASMPLTVKRVGREMVPPSCFSEFPIGTVKDQGRPNRSHR